MAITPERRNDPEICNKVAVILGFKDFEALQQHADSLRSRQAVQLATRFKQEYTKINPNYQRQPYSYF